jgi:hypothetical protein
MPKLHIANTFFEWEVENAPKLSLREAFLQNPIFLQLQFLPVVYGEQEDGMLLSDLPDPEYWASLSKDKISPLSDFLHEAKEFPKKMEIESWGPSQLIADWAKSKGLNYSMPDWQTVKEVNSKHFSFEHTPRLPGAELLSSEGQAKQWLCSFSGKKVLKTCYGVSGKGHLIIETADAQFPRIAQFLHGEWKKNLPVIGEPWVERILDFSTQWDMDKEGKISYLGGTICKNDSRGQYQYNEVGEERDLFGQYNSFLLEHQKKARALLTLIAGKGFFGNIGIDAMLYKFAGDILLQPVVEINARKTMGWAALSLQKRYFPDKKIRLSYTPRKEGFLPKFLVLKHGKKVTFQRNLYAS